MSIRQFLKIRIGFTIGITVVLGALLLYQYLHIGIPSHHFLARNDMPLVSNVWGIVTIPLFTWFLLWLVSQRLFKHGSKILFPENVIIAFGASLVFGLALGLSIQFGSRLLPSNVPIVLFVLALLLPTYRAEYFLGFVLGLTYFVGGVLPIVIGVVFLLLSAITYLYVRALLIWIFRLIVKKT